LGARASTQEQGGHDQDHEERAAEKVHTQSPSVALRGSHVTPPSFVGLPTA
jgi:hypothetical protein